LCTTATNGTLIFNSDGTFSYTPNPNFNGVEKFIYQLCDVNNDCDTAVVCITVAPVDDMPTATPDKITTLEDTPIISASVTPNDILSGDSGNIYNIQCAVCTTTMNGILTFNPNGTYNYTPSPNFNGTDSFIYQICDADGDCDTAIVVITIMPVDDIPVANTDYVVTNEDTPLIGISVIGNDTPVGDIPNTFNVTCTVCTNPMNGTLVFYPNGTFDYTPNPSFSGIDFFTYQICDADGDCDTAKVYISVNPIDDKPLANSDQITSNEDMPIVNASVTPNDILSGDGGNVFNNICPLCTSTSNGTLTFNPNGTYNYTPNPNFSGSDYFVYQICDIDGDCDTAIVNIKILPTNDVPLAVFDTKTITEDTPIINASVTANDTPSGDGGNIYNNTCPLCTTTSNGTLTFNANGTYNYTPNPNFNGTDTFIYQLCDVNNDCDTAIVFIMITPVNDVPTAIFDKNTTTEDMPIINASVTPNDILSGDGGNIFNNTCPLCTTTSNGTLTFNSNGTYNYSPNLNFNGTDTFIYQICDANGDCDTTTVLITITTMDEAPIAKNDTLTIPGFIAYNGNVSGNDIMSGDGGNAFNVDCVTCSFPTNGILVFHTDGSYTYTPNPNFVGTDTFTYQVCDIDGDCDMAVVYLTVMPFICPPKVGLSVKIVRH
jgi:predicted DCC family thiol-disulfide oxidoreductase YuxK